MLHVLYLVHDLVDPAVRRRVMMLKAGGAKVTLAGFRRARGAAAEFGDIAPIDLGVTRDGRFAQRLAAVARAALTLGAKLRGVAKPDLIIGRNLEMLALANRAKALFSAERRSSMNAWTFTACCSGRTASARRCAPPSGCSAATPCC